MVVLSLRGREGGAVSQRVVLSLRGREGGAVSQRVVLSLRGCCCLSEGWYCLSEEVRVVRVVLSLRGWCCLSEGVAVSQRGGTVSQRK